MVYPIDVARATKVTVARREDDLDRLFHALSDPTRRAIVRELSHGDATISELAEPFDMTLPGFTKHLAVLERAGLVHRERVGKAKRCRLDIDALDDADQWIASCRIYWRETLASLVEFLEGPGTGHRRRKKAL
jgi:DNA-binding transcriptional ArsR family regulator